MGGAARDLARTVAAAVAHEPVALTVKNQSALSAADTAEIRRVFESELKTAGQPAAEVRIAISENLTQFLLVAEIHRQGDRQVLLESWPRTPAPSAAAPQDKPARVTLEKKLVWEQDQPILDVAQSGDAMLVLDATRVLLVRGAERQSAPIPATHPWPRDIRGRLSVSDSAFTAYLPGAICRGTAQPQLSLVCRDSPDPWLLAPGAIALFAPDRNLFPGHIDVEPGGAPPAVLLGRARGRRLDLCRRRRSRPRLHAFLGIRRRHRPVGQRYRRHPNALRRAHSGHPPHGPHRAGRHPNLRPRRPRRKRRRTPSRRTGDRILRTHYRAMVRRQLRHGGLARSPNRTLCGFHPGSHLRFLARRPSAARPPARATAELCALRCWPPRPPSPPPPPMPLRFARWLSKPWCASMRRARRSPVWRYPGSTTPPPGAGSSTFGRRSSFTMALR